MDARYQAMLLVAAYCGLRAGELIALHRQHVDMLHRRITVVEQVQGIGGTFKVSAPKSAAGRRAVPVPGIVVDALDGHLRQLADPGQRGVVFPAPEGGYLRLETSAGELGRPPWREPASLRCVTTTSGTRALRLPSLRAPM